MTKGNDTKQKVLSAAVALFNSQGFNGTSIRDIAKEAGVNPALISYYFKGKNGLLESLITSFLEGYLAELEIASKKGQSPRETLLAMLDAIFSYQHQRYHLSRFAQREITLDTFLVRELQTTYLRKEKYLFSLVIEKGMKNGDFNKLPVAFVILQLKSLVTMPFLHPQYLSEVLHIVPSEKYFADRYVHQMNIWVKSFLTQDSEKLSSPLLSLTAHS